MSLRPTLAGLVGRWTGNYRLHTPQPDVEVHESKTDASVELRVKEQFLTVEYDWEYDGKRQEGVLILGCDEVSDAVQVVWTDSWHMSHKFIVFDGTVDNSGHVNVIGTYFVPDQPDWQWRTEILPSKDLFEIRMYNVSPEGGENIAVAAGYTREKENEND
jgi:hypothetical protein